MQPAMAEGCLRSESGSFHVKKRSGHSIERATCKSLRKIECQRLSRWIYRFNFRSSCGFLQVESFFRRFPVFRASHAMALISSCLLMLQVWRIDRLLNHTHELVRRKSQDTEHQMAHHFGMTPYAQVTTSKLVLQTTIHPLNRTAFVIAHSFCWL